MKSELIFCSLNTTLVPGGVEYTVLLPPGYDKTSEPLPLLLNMHGGGLDRNYLAEPETRAMYEKLWAEGALPPMVVACYSARGGWHLNYRDGTEKWEDFAFEFMQFMQKNLQHKPRSNPQLPHRHLYGRHGFLTPHLKIPGTLWRSSRYGRRDQPST